MKKGHNYGKCRKCGEIHHHPNFGKPKPYKGKTFVERYGSVERANEIIKKMSIGIKKAYKEGRKKPVRNFGSKNPMRRDDVKAKHKLLVQRAVGSEWRKNSSNALKGRKVGGALKPKQVSKSVKALWQDENSVYNSKNYRKKLSKRRVYYKYKNEFGEKFQSSWEYKFANFLRKEGIDYEIRKTVWITEKHYRIADFYLPSLNLYCEIIGLLSPLLVNSRNYNNMFRTKLCEYKKLGIDYLCIYPQDFRDLKRVFEDKRKETYISEVFTSFSGEGLTIGKVYNFVRFEGCNMSCKGCDTTYAFKRENKINLRQILDLLKVSWCNTKHRSVFLTGGEPTIAPYILDFVKLLKRHKFYIHIQTNGSNFSRELFNICNFISCDIKTPVFGVESSDKVIKNISKFYPSKHEFKAVIKNREDIDYIKKKIVSLELSSSTFILQPFDEILSKSGTEYLKGINKSLKFITKNIILDKFWSDKKVRVLPQLHKLAYGNKRGT